MNLCKDTAANILSELAPLPGETNYVIGVAYQDGVSKYFAVSTFHGINHSLNEVAGMLEKEFNKAQP